jgi:hypothetical protein
LGVVDDGGVIRMGRSGGLGLLVDDWFVLLQILRFFRFPLHNIRVDNIAIGSFSCYIGCGFPRDDDIVGDDQSWFVGNDIVLLVSNLTGMQETRLGGLVRDFSGGGRGYRDGGWTLVGLQFGSTSAATPFVVLWLTQNQRYKLKPRNHFVAGGATLRAVLPGGGGCLAWERRAGF